MTNEENNIPVYIKKEDNSKIHITNIGKTFVDVKVKGNVK